MNNERLMDLVRFARHHLFNENLISNEEYAALVFDSDNGKRVARLESYDEIRSKLAQSEAERERLQNALDDAQGDLSAYEDALIQCYGEDKGDGAEETLACAIQRLQRLAGQGISLRAVFGNRVFDLDDEQTHEFCEFLRDAGAERDRLARELDDWRNREAECCPEDVGFPEYIAALKRERDGYRNMLAAYRDALGQNSGLSAIAELKRELAEAQRKTAALCVAIAEGLSRNWWTDYKCGEHRADPEYQGMSDGAEDVAEAIRREFGLDAARQAGERKEGADGK